MLVTTKNSVYDVQELRGGIFKVTKVKDLVPAGHPHVKVGDSFTGHAIRVREGEPFVFWGEYRGIYREIETTDVVSVEPIPRVPRPQEIW